MCFWLTSWVVSSLRFGVYNKTLVKTCKLYLLNIHISLLVISSTQRKNVLDLAVKVCSQYIINESVDHKIISHCFISELPSLMSNEVEAITIRMSLCCGIIPSKAWFRRSFCFIISKKLKKVHFHSIISSKYDRYYFKR